MRSGCGGVFLRLGTSVASAVLVAVGVLLLLLSFFSFAPSANLGTAVLLLGAGAAAYLFVRVGRDIWRELRAQLPADKDAGSESPEEDDARPPSG
jgi:hypothetical protein